MTLTLVTIRVDCKVRCAQERLQYDVYSTDLSNEEVHIDSVASSPTKDIASLPKMIYTLLGLEIADEAQQSFSLFCCGGGCPWTTRSHFYDIACNGLAQFP